VYITIFSGDNKIWRASVPPWLRGCRQLRVLAAVMGVGRIFSRGPTAIKLHFTNSQPRGTHFLL